MPVRRAAERRCKGGPLHGWPVARRVTRGRDVWIDRQGRCFAAPADGRFLYRVRGDVLEFVGHGARRCDGCGVTIDPDPDTGARLAVCPLCGAR